jgi:CMP-N,N'-diacetyllegionaminic acid synthase
MISDSSVIIVIPARAGSKGLPGKNVRPLCGKPLIAWTIEKALRSRHADVVVVSTDGPDIAEVGRRYGADVPFLRPAALATDTASTYDVISHAIEHYQKTEQRTFAYTVLMEPTSPLREDDDVDRMLEELDANASGFDSIVSIGRVSEHPSIMKALVGDRIEPYCPALSHAARRQDNPPAYFPYGVAYIAKTALLLQARTFYVERCMGFPIKRYQNYEIDDIYDWVCVEQVMKHEWGLS